MKDDTARVDIVTVIEDIFRRRGAESYLGEAVTMAEHMLQSAAGVAALGAPDAVVAGALLHDIGHYSGEFPEDALEQGVNNHHDATGAALLAAHFPPLVCACVRWHVEAKRYLCAVEPAYHDGLSEASRHSLRLQGGAMNEAECRRFEARPHLSAILAVRRADDDGKRVGTQVPPFAHYRPLLRRLVAEHTGRG